MWLAPAGGRDRPNADDEWLPAPFDASAVELMRTLLGKAKRPGHLYPFAMSSWAIMPPPRVSKVLSCHRNCVTTTSLIGLIF